MLKMDEKGEVLMLELINVGKRYKNVKAIEDLSFSMKEGEVLGLIGENGAGKSTTLSMIATITKPDSGVILFNGEDIMKCPKKLRRVLGFVPQDIALYESLTGYDNVLFWGKAYHVSEKAVKARLSHICDMVSFSKEDLHKKVQEYSGGMKRKLNIAVALLHEPKIVIMDEPTVGIDIRSRNQILAAINQMKKQGTSVLYVGHYMEEIETICDRIVVLNQGTCVYNATMEEATRRETGKIPLEQLYVELIK